MARRKDNCKCGALKCPESRHCRPCAMELVGDANRRPVGERFWKFVEPIPEGDGCWIWTGSQTPKGYGYFWFTGGKWRSAHRASWEIHNGPIPDGLHVLHRCDNPPCVNPAHLFLGTGLDNSRDCYRKGRAKLGAQRFGAKLDDAKVIEIRRRLANKEQQAAIAREFGISTAVLYNIRMGIKWKHVGGITG